ICPPSCRSHNVTVSVLSCILIAWLSAFASFRTAPVFKPDATPPRCHHSGCDIARFSSGRFSKPRFRRAFTVSFLKSFLVAIKCDRIVRGIERNILVRCQEHGRGQKCVACGCSIEQILSQPFSPPFV